MDKDLLIGVIVPCVLLMLPPIAKWLRRYFDSDYIKLKANFNEALNTIEAYQALEQNYNAELIKHSGATRKKSSTSYY
ncbi:hypothetical protein UA42_14690 [Photobacterium kishitanii]|uniref:hypothetical protein n=1 Tax=Photobacterium kishitanii TaxID=318456 RepID=UPI0005D41C66|nr:hypothetical protein [Photobacterium kishitanii]KJG60596.1 hypothetical protein UA42_14690 [Photobacterium kishitanii]KJG64898.1 hypothetical protein UA40_14385 [Photobacterium kishitanii]KJG68534.1 hypothetical protein UA41_16795 [Photobacterium kishitanii]OBU31428.1 hypothetical protein AYY23_19390 [Photobacterium kishitanii]